MILLLLLGGLAALFFGAEWLVRGSSSLAVRFGISPLLVGLTIVAYGTSTPELIVSATAAMAGQGGIAVGNVVGSNLFNIGVILGLTALLCPLRVQLQLLRFDMPVMIAASLLFLLFFRDGAIQRWEGLVFLALIVIYTVANIRMAQRTGSPAVEQEFAEGVPPPTRSKAMDAVLIVAGLGTLIIGSRWFVSGAVDLARLLGWSEAVIGLTIVSAGTSLPELASSLIAAWRRQPDIAIGNVVGSNIYNILATVGASGVLAAPLAAGGIGLEDTVTMIAFSGLMAVIAWTGHKLHRWEGALLLGLYLVYLYRLWPSP